MSKTLPPGITAKSAAVSKVVIGCTGLQATVNCDSGSLRACDTADPAASKRN